MMLFSCSSKNLLTTKAICISNAIKEYVQIFKNDKHFEYDFIN